jgi:outer membrane protein assembly factor BamA
VGVTHRRLGASESFVKVDGGYRQYFTVARRHTVWPGLRFAWATSVLPDVERVYLGGVLAEERYREMGLYNYVPFVGLRPRALPGDIMALVSLGYRFMVLKDLYLTLVVDWGNAWEEPRLANFSDLLSDLGRQAPVGLGLGVAYNSLIGPIRFSWGRLLRSAEPLEEGNVLYFSVGHDF